MNSKILYLTGSMILLMPTLVFGNEYIPPPTGPYQSTVVINTVEQNSLQKHHVYKFPQDDLVEPGSLDSRLPSSTIQGSAGGPLKGGPGPYYMPEPAEPASPVTQRQPVITGPAFQPYYDPSLYNNPWSENSTPQQQGYQGQWNNPNNAYGYYQYPYGYSNRYESMGPPYTGMSPPWSMMPMKPFSGR